MSGHNFLVISSSQRQHAKQSTFLPSISSPSFDDTFPTQGF